MQASAPPLPAGAAPRNDVVSAALSTSLGLAVIGAGFRNFASSAASHGWPVPDLAAGMPLPGVVLDGAAVQLPLLDLSHVGYALAVAAGVTAARAAALELWPAFREESERANKQVRSYVCGVASCMHRRMFALQVLPSLSTADTLLISLATGASEARSAVPLQCVSEQLRLCCCRRSSCFDARCCPVWQLTGAAFWCLPPCLARCMSAAGGAHHLRCGQPQLVWLMVLWQWFCATALLR